MMNENLPRASESDGRSIWEVRASYREIVVKSLGEMMNMMSDPIPRDHMFVTTRELLRVGLVDRTECIVSGAVNGIVVAVMS